MKILFFLLLFIATNANAGVVFLRSDGGSASECSGLVDAAKSPDKKCALNSFESAMVVSGTNSDTISMTKGAFVVSVKLDQHNITMAQFVATPKLYTDAVVAGKKVNILNYNGKNFELILK